MVAGNKVKELAIIAMLSAASVAGRVVMTPIPGLQPTTVIVMVTTMGLGLRQGLLVVLISTMVSNLQLGHGVWTLFQLLAWSVVAVISYFYGKSRWSNYLIISSVVAGFTGIIYGMIVSLNGLLFTKRIIAYYLAGLPHDITHAIGNFAIYFAIGGRLQRLLKSYSAAYFGRK
ncbi:MAG TPA: ECF transporter S component [Firmicutes bacterium]|nr:ECF transporter S component [Bacillota bacterium]